MNNATMRITILLVAILSPLFAVANHKMPQTGLYDGEQGRLLFHSDDNDEYLQAPTLKTDVSMTITGLVARVKVSQHFTNPTEQWLNGLYTFPLPELSAVDHLSMRIGERVIEGQIKEKKKALKIFQKARALGKKASLVEQHRANMFTNNVANIGPKETIVIDIEYQQTLRYDMGEFSIRFPMVVAPRYRPNNKPIDDFAQDGWARHDSCSAQAEFESGEVSCDKASISDEPLPKLAIIDQDNGSVNSMTISISLQTGFPLASLTSDSHPVIINELTDQHFEIAFKDPQTLANRDFVLRWKPMPSTEPQGAFFIQQKGDDNYALLMVLPPYEPDAASQVLVKEMVFIIDTSGSMHGESMEQAKAALLLGLNKLKATDRFNIVEFNSSANRLFNSAMPASSESISRARRFVRGLTAQGGTNIADALNEVLHPNRDDGALRQLIFITDGSVANEQELFDMIHADLGDSRLFTVGIGSAPNSRFMRGAATFGRGTFTYIGAVSQVKEKMAQLFSKLENPFLSDISITGNDGSELDVQADYWPNPVGDLYLGEPLMVSLKLPLGQQNLSISGQLASQDWHMDLPIASGGTHKGLDVLWARNKIRSLSENARTPTERKNNALLITELGLVHHLVTRYTSLIAVDVTPSNLDSEQATTKTVSTHLPDGWTAHKPHGQLPRGATSAQLNLIVGLSLLLLTGLFGLVRQKVT